VRVRCDVSGIVGKYPPAMFRRRGKVDPPGDTAPAPAEVYLGLRAQILNLDPSSVGIAETGYSKGTATLVCLSDGTTSLYTSSGFGIIGGGSHAEVVGATTQLIEVLDHHLAETSPSARQSLPAEGRTVIHALTREGPRTFEASENELGEGRSVMSPVFHAAQRVITQLRLIDEARH
jgi:hypothetical protein